MPVHRIKSGGRPNLSQDEGKLSMVEEWGDFEKSVITNREDISNLYFNIGPIKITTDKV